MNFFEVSVGNHGDGGNGGKSGGDHLGGVGISFGGNEVLKSLTSTPSPGGVGKSVLGGGGGSNVSIGDGGLLEPSTSDGSGNSLDGIGGLNWWISGLISLDGILGSNLSLDGGVEAPVEGLVVSGSLNSGGSGGLASGGIGDTLGNGGGGPGIITLWVDTVETFLSGGGGDEGGESSVFHNEKNN